MVTTIVPDRNRMETYLDQGLTQQQIVERWEQDSGIRVSRSAIAMAINRYGLSSSKPRARYEDTLPWTVKMEHKNHADARMLRLEGRRRMGGALNEHETRLLADWKQRLRDYGAVVTYEADTEQGFFWVHARASDGDDLIRRPGGGAGGRGLQAV